MASSPTAISGGSWAPERPSGYDPAAQSYWMQGDGSSPGGPASSSDQFGRPIYGEQAVPPASDPTAGMMMQAPSSPVSSPYVPQLMDAPGNVGFNPAGGVPSSDQFGRAISVNPNYASYTPPPNPNQVVGPGGIDSLHQLTYTPGATGPAGSPLTVGSPPQSTPSGNGGYMDFLRQLVQQMQGSPIDSTPAWQGMVAAQQRNIDQQRAQMGEQFGASGNRFSTAFGSAMGDFTNQAALDQNSLLGQMMLQSQTDAKNRQYQGAGQLAGFQNQQQMQGLDINAAMQRLMAQIGSNESMQGKQISADELMQQAGFNFQGGQNDLQRQLQQALQSQLIGSQEHMQGSDLAAQMARLQAQLGSAASLQSNDISGMMARLQAQLGSTADLQANQLDFQGGQNSLDRQLQQLMMQNQLSFQGGQNDLNRSLQASTTAFNAGTNSADIMAQLQAQGASSLFGAENTAGLNASSQDMQMQQLMAQMAQAYGGLDQSNLSLGNQLGSTQYSQQQDAINRAYQEYLRTQPEYNPTLPAQQQAANAYPNLFQPQYSPSQLGSLLGGVGSLLGAAPGLISGIAGLFKGTPSNTTGNTPQGQTSGGGINWGAILGGALGGLGSLGGILGIPGLGGNNRGGTISNLDLAQLVSGGGSIGSTTPSFNINSILSLMSPNSMYSPNGSMNMSNPTYPVGSDIFSQFGSIPFGDPSFMGIG